MSEEEELQEQEKEVLISIYEGDVCFKQVSSTVYQYKYGDQENESFVVEISWGPKYPNEKPTVNLDIFYNRNIIQSIKERVAEILDTEADQWIGCGMTYTLFECLKDKVAELIEEQKNTEVATLTEEVEKVDITNEQESEPTKKAEKKEQLTKAQKRRAWDRAEVGRGGERPRGYDWMDIVKHLSQVPHDQHVSS